MSSSDAMRSAILRTSKDTTLVPTTKLLQAVASAGVKFVDKGEEALKAAAARVAATSSRYGDRLASVSMTGVLSKALPHPGIGVLHTGGERDGGSLGKVGAPLVDPGEMLKEGKGVKRPRGGEGPPEPSGAVSLAGGECAPLLRPKGGSGKSARGWFDLPAPPMTLELKRELLILRNRNFLDPTRRYKTSREDREKLPKHFSIGTVVESAGEGQSKRLSKAERRPTLLASLQSDPVFQDYANRTMAKVRERAEGGGILAYREKKAAAGADWKKKRAAYKAAHKGGKKKGKKLY